jgi:uncharacterized membrane protein YccC
MVRFLKSLAVWLPQRDKLLHFVGGQVLFVVAAVAFKHWHPYVLGILFGTLVACAWEYVQWRLFGRWEAWDAAASILGTLTAWLIAWRL